MFTRQLNVVFYGHPKYPNGVLCPSSYTEETLPQDLVSEHPDRIYFFANHIDHI